MGYKCFGCGRGGDVINFVQEYSGASFTQALDLLCREAGVERTTQRKESADTSLYRVLSDASALYQRALESHPAAQQYLHDRGIDYKQYGIGWSGRGILPDASLDALEGAGLMHNKRTVFFERIMFPIVHGNRICGFGGRTLCATSGPKYLNSPQTAVFNKSNLLYSVSSFKRLPHREVFFVEGYTDVIALADAGFLAVASMGTSVTEMHLKQLWSISSRPYIAFDGDAAGRRAAERFIDIALPHLSHDRSIKIIMLPSGIDPAEVVRTAGAGGWAGYRDNATDLIDVFQSKISGTPEDQQAALAVLRKQIQRIQDRELRERYHAALLRNRPPQWVPRLRIAPTPPKLHLIFGMLHRYPELCVRFQEQVCCMEVDPRYNVLKQEALSIAEGKTPGMAWEAAGRWGHLVAQVEGIEDAAQVWLELFGSYQRSASNAHNSAVQRYLRNPTQEHWEMLLKE